jgi:Ca2+-binding RTX toxin-like protein
MKRMALVMLVGALLLALIGGVASAVTVEENRVCDSKPCTGTNNADQLQERQGNGVSDEIKGKDGGDTLNARPYTNDTDKLYGQDGADKLNTDDGDSKDLANGGPGHDTCIIDKNDNRKSCEEVIKNP